MEDRIARASLGSLGATLAGKADALPLSDAQIARRSEEGSHGWAVQVYTDLDNVHGLWDSIYTQTPNAGPFMTWDYVAIWWRHFGAAYQLHILVATEQSGSGRRVLLPLMRKGLQLKWIATPGSDYVALLYDSPDALDDGLRAFAQHLRKSLWTKLSLYYLRPADAEKLISALDGFTYRKEEDLGCPYIEIEGRSWPDYLAGLSHSRRGDMRAVERKLEKENLPVRYETTRDPARIEELFPLMKEITIHSHIPAKKSLFEGTRGAFLLTLLKSFAVREWLYVKIIYLNEQPASYTVCYTMHGRTGYWMAAYDEKYNRFSLGKLLLFHLIKSSFESQDDVFDMMQGLQQYKLLWTDKVQPLTYLIIYRSPLLLRAANFEANARAWLEQNPRIAKIKERLRAFSPKALLKRGEQSSD
jgi:CelD/BcsL family acetyltransferase involved in cellulose biosynthesis